MSYLIYSLVEALYLRFIISITFIFFVQKLINCAFVWKLTIVSDEILELVDGSKRVASVLRP